MATQKINELLDMKTKFVSIVSAGANRQSKFAVVKNTDTAAPDNGENIAKNEPQNQKPNDQTVTPSSWLSTFKKVVTDKRKCSTKDKVAKSDETVVVSQEQKTKAPTTDNSEVLEIIQKSKDEISALRATIEQQQTQLVNLTKSLATTVGATTALPAKENIEPIEKTQDSEAIKKWHAGGDLASLTTGK